MAKILTARELSKIVSDAIQDPAGFVDEEACLSFIRMIATSVVTAFGGDVGTIDLSEDNSTWYVPIHLTDDVPADGGVYKDYDTDVTWKNSKET